MVVQWGFLAKNRSQWADEAPISSLMWECPRPLTSTTTRIIAVWTWCQTLMEQSIYDAGSTVVLQALNVSVDSVTATLCFLLSQLSSLEQSPISDKWTFDKIWKNLRKNNKHFLSVCVLCECVAHVCKRLSIYLFRNLQNQNQDATY